MDTARRDDLTDEFRRRLADARVQILRTVAHTDEELATMEGHQPGSPSEDASKGVAQAVLSRLQGREKHELDEISAAQARLEAGTFGVCARCNQPIPLSRLWAMPTARFCRACQARVEG